MDTFLTVQKYNGYSIKSGKSYSTTLEQLQLNNYYI